MSHPNRPPKDTGTPSAVVSALTRLSEALKTHWRTWSRRYIAMRVEARDGDR